MLCFGSGKTPTETVNLIKEVYGKGAMSRSQIYDWYAKFKTGRESTKDDPRSGRPVTVRVGETVDSVRDLMESSDRRPSISEVAGKLNISYGMCHRIVTEDLNGSAKKALPSKPAEDREKAQRSSVARDRDEKTEITITSSNGNIDENIPTTSDALKMKLKLDLKMKLKLSLDKNTSSSLNSVVSYHNLALYLYFRAKHSFVCRRILIVP